MRLALAGSKTRQRLADGYRSAHQDRADDIIPFAEMFVSQYNEKYHRSVQGFSADGEAAMKAYGWSGNVRELQNVVEKAVILCEGDEIKAADLQLKSDAKGAAAASAPAQETLEQAEERAIREAMAQCDGNLSMVAKMLGVSRPTLYSKLRKYGI